MIVDDSKDVGNSGYGGAADGRDGGHLGDGGESGCRDGYGGAAVCDDGEPIFQCCCSYLS